MSTTVERVPLATGHPRLAALMVGVLALLVLAAGASVFVIVRSAELDDDTGFFGAGAAFTALVSVGIILGFFYPVWFIEPRATRAIRDHLPAARVWPGFRTPGLVELSPVDTSAPMPRRVYFAVGPESLTVWHRQDSEIVRVLEIPRSSIRSVTQQTVGTRMDLQPGVQVAFGSVDAPTLLQLMPRAIRSNSDVAARTLAAALAPA